MASSSSPTPPSTSTLIALASSSFIAVFLLPHTTALILKLSLSFPNPPRSIFHRPYYDRVTFVLPALSSFLYGVGAVFSLLSITRYTQDGGEFSLGRGFVVVHGVTQMIGRFGAIVCLLVLLSTFGPRSSRRASRAHLAPFTAMIVVFLFALGLASMVLSIYLFSSNGSTTATLRILSIVQPALYLATLFLTLATFTLLSLLFRSAEAISHPDGNRGSVAEDFLASNAAKYGVRPTSTSTVPPRILHHLNYSSTISKLVPRILAATLAGLVAAGLQLADRLLDRDLFDTTHIGISIGRGICEVVWIVGVTHLFYGLCKPRPKIQRTHTEADDEPAAPNPHLRPSSSGNHLLQARNYPASSSSPGSASTTLPHTPATPTFPAAPKAALRDEICPSGGGQEHHHRGPVANTGGYAPTYLETGSNPGLDGAAVGGPGTKLSATVSEEFLALRTDDPFSSPPPGTVVLPKVPSGTSVRKRKGAAVVPKATSETTAPAASATPKSKARPKTSSSDDVLADGWKDSHEGALQASNSGGGPSSKKARTVAAGENVYGAHGGGIHAKLSKRSSQKPTFSRRPSNKRRRSGGVNKSKKETIAAETTNGVASPFGDVPSAVPGTTRPRPPRSPVPRPSRPVEETNSLGLIMHDHRSMSGPSVPSQDYRQLTSTASNATPAAKEDERLLKSVVTSALALKHHQQVQYLDPAAVALPREAGLRADYSVDGVGAGEEKDRRSGSTTPTPKSREDAGPTPRGGSPTPESNVPPLLQQERRKDFKFTTVVGSSVSTGTGSPVPFPHPTIYERPAFDEPARLHVPAVALLESFPRTPSLADATMSIGSLPSASDLPSQSTSSPYQYQTPFMLTNDPPSSFEASAPIDIPATRTAARNHHRRRAPSTSILEAARAMPIVSSLGGAPPAAAGPRKLHKPNSSSYDAARAGAHAIMTRAEVRPHHQQSDAPQIHDTGNGVTNNLRLWSRRVSGEPAPTNTGAGGELQVPPTSISPPGLPLLKSRFSDPTTTGTESSGDGTSSTGGADAGSESSFK
ncbi:hypothetical protein M407DRAFT_17659 [Tulasnella calospora MUT 4182]|uniref:Uncharacterized protein n=1 Tax=Tulasnella calospora MUT 4182 TaxID=1051891 RepID=A0A0C3QV51_9AGAM|nr:hypothetical protein M407DRAFT_17659 [Tulasnella calospora MUT 4182]